MMQFLKDFRGQLSWGRFCALVALIMACAGQLSGRMQAAELAIWLGLALGNYGASKLAERAGE